jgi:2-C-methyl-D-erythritol 4-phosphate cytidylyltransferase
MGVLVAAVVLAGGSGERSERIGGKQLARVAGRPVVSWSLSALDEAGLPHIVLVRPRERAEEYRASVIDPLGLAAAVTVADAGPTRHDSVLAGVAALPAGIDIVIVHDGARPLVEPEVVRGAVTMLIAHPEADGVVVGHPSVDTLKLVDAGRVLETVDRQRVWIAQTPQVFRLPALVRAHGEAARGGPGTDDAALVERGGGTVLMFEGPRDNIKVTLPEDFALVESVLARRISEE